VLKRVITKNGQKASYRYIGDINKLPTDIVEALSFQTVYINSKYNFGPKEFSILIRRNKNKELFCLELNWSVRLEKEVKTLFKVILPIVYMQSVNLLSIATFGQKARKDFHPIHNLFTGEYWARLVEPVTNNQFHCVPDEVAESRDSFVPYAIVNKILQNIPDGRLKTALTMQKDPFLLTHYANLSLTPEQQKSSFEVNLKRMKNGIEKERPTCLTLRTIAMDLTAIVVPTDDFGFPLDIAPPPLDLDDVCTVGYANTSGGMSKNARYLKSTIPQNTMDELSLLISNAHNKHLPMNCAFASLKQELIKIKSKDDVGKLRAFAIQSALTNALSRILIGPMLDSQNDCPSSQKLIGTTLGQGVGAFLLSQKLTNAGLTGIMDGPYVLDEERLMDIKAANADYTGFEYQHHLYQGVIGNLCYLTFYNLIGYIKQQRLLGYLLESDLFSDLHVHQGLTIRMGPSQVPSGKLTTLDANSNINKINFHLAFNRLFLNGNANAHHYYVCKNTSIVGDDSLIVGTDQHIDAFASLISVLKDEFKNEITLEKGYMMASPDANCFDDRACDFLKMKPIIYTSVFTKKKIVAYVKTTEQAALRGLYPNRSREVVNAFIKTLSNAREFAGNRTMFSLNAINSNALMSYMKKYERINTDYISIKAEAYKDYLETRKYKYDPNDCDMSIKSFEESTKNEFEINEVKVNNTRGQNATYSIHGVCRDYLIATYITID